VWVRTRQILRAVAVAITFSLAVPTLSAADPVAPAVSATAMPICPVRVSVDQYKERPDTALFTIWSDDDAGYVSGSIAFYVGTALYRLPFTHIIAANYWKLGISPTPLLVKFTGPTTIDSAYFESLEGAACPIHSPWVNYAAISGKQTGKPSGFRYGPDWSKTLADLAKNAGAITAPAPEAVAAPACATPYAAARIVTPWRPETPEVFNLSWTGSVVVTVAIRPDGSVAGTRADRPSPETMYTNSALNSAARTRYAAGVYRCEPVSGTYLFIVQFGG
jgi:hypothetical protein